MHLYVLPFRRSELKNREAVSSKILERSIDPNNDYCDLIVDNIYESVTDAIYQNNSPIKARVGVRGIAVFV